jgi:hypothetical protein
LTLRFNAAQPRPPVLPGALSISGEGQEWTVLCNGALNELKIAAERMAARVVDEGMPSLDEIFIARTESAAHAKP